MDAAGSGNRDEHGRRVAVMFGRIAGWYDFLNHFLSFGLDLVWRKRLVSHLAPLAASGGPVVLDLAAGTLDVSRAIVRRYPGARVAAMDFALPMLVRGRVKLDARERSAVLTALADGRELPLKAASVDGVTIAFGIRNILPRSRAHAEILRVLRPGGRYCILEFGAGRKRILKGLYNFYLNRLLPLLGRVVSGDARAYRYLAETIKAFPDENALDAELLASGFARVVHEPLAWGIVYIHVAEKKGAAEKE
ncbi:MAG: ubiquinone/menaquinone biosynthesis methyltransferase [Desulfovibrionaceae bacterium]|nr:ubiquinone/menaquinone biosynthesis methyltransferase [Desulfovibrionaceae bacterium]MBF0514871.1 ubiquinone/menaquinone biosynthesis methyltransferase [Desulfovibrionaceae bacterium]